MIIDFDHLTEEQATLFCSQKREVVCDYNKLSSDLLAKDDKLVWLLNNLTSRNPNYSDLLYILSCIKLIKTISETSTIDYISTTNYHLYKIVKSHYKTFYSSTLSSHYLFSLKSYFHNVIFILIWSLGAIFSYSRKRKSIQVDDVDIDIDSFYDKKDAKFVDRYYGNYFDHLTTEQKRRMSFVLIYLPIPIKRDIDIIASTSPINVVYLWDFLKLKDYLISFWRCFYQKKRKFHYFYCDIEISKYLNIIYHKNNDFYFYLGFLYERFIYRLNNNGVNIKLYIDWFENQSYDKSFYWAMHKYYPEVPIRAYIGFINDIESSPMIVTSNIELQKHIAPRNIRVCNSYYRDAYHDYLGDVSVIPFYRSQYIWNVERARSKGKVLNVLVPLGLSFDEVNFKVDYFISLIQKFNPNDFVVILKPHPTYKENLIKMKIKSTPNIQIVNGNIYEYLKIASIVIAANSTTTYESLALKIPIIQLIDNKCKYTISQPQKTDGLWENVVSVSNFIETARNLIQNTNRPSFDIKTYFFEKVDNTNNDNLIRI